MGHYRKVDTRIWNDEWFRNASAECQRLFLYALTCPNMTSMGCMKATESGMAEELGMGLKAFREAFREAFAKGSMKASWKDCFVCVPNFLRYNRPESPNVVRSWGALIDAMPECPMRDAYFAEVKAFVEGFGEAFAKALPEAFAKGSRDPLPNLGTLNSELGTLSSELARGGCKGEVPLAGDDSLAASPPCAEPSPDGETHAPEPVLTFPVNGKSKTWGLPQSWIDENQELYPSMDVLAECRKALAWIKNNPAKRKTAKGMTRFLGSWLERANNNNAYVKKSDGFKPPKAEGEWF